MNKPETPEGEEQRPNQPNRAANSNRGRPVAVIDPYAPGAIKSRGRRGAPSHAEKAAGLVLDAGEVARLYMEGGAEAPDGRSTQHSVQALAAYYGVAVTAVRYQLRKNPEAWAMYRSHAETSVGIEGGISRKQQMKERRLATKETLAKVDADQLDEDMAMIRLKVNERLVELEAQELLLSTPKKLAFLDVLFAKFVEAFVAGKIPCNNIADLDRLMRLQELISGNADSRQQVMGNITIEAMQQRYLALKALPLEPSITGELTDADMDEVSQHQAVLEGAIQAPDPDAKADDDSIADWDANEREALQKAKADALKKKLEDEDSFAIG